MTTGTAALSREVPMSIPQFLDSYVFPRIIRRKSGQTTMCGHKSDGTAISAKKEISLNRSVTAGKASIPTNENTDSARVSFCSFKSLRPLSQI